MSEKNLNPINEEMTLTDFLVEIRDRYGDKERNAIHKEYYQGNKNEQITQSHHSLIVGGAVTAIRLVTARGGAQDEVERCLKYFMVCMDARKYFLNYKKAYLDLEIGDLLEKYGGKRKRVV